VLKRIFAAAVMTAGLLGVTTAAAQGQVLGGHAHHGSLPGVRVVNLHRAYLAQLRHVRPGKIAGIVYARGHRPRVRPAAAATCTEPACPLLYNGGPEQITPAVYLVLWGPNWATDTGTSSYLENFYKGLGVRQGSPKDTWSTILSQYANASAQFPVFTQSVFGGMIADSSVPPVGATQAQIAAEADASATTFGITDTADAEIVVATQSGTCPVGFDDASCPGGAGNDCGWHSFSNEPYINLPYLPDAGAACGADLVNPTGTDDGFSLVGGAEFADTVTDPNPPGTFQGPSPSPGWIDTGDTVSGGEVASKCQWGTSYAGPTGDVTLSTGTFAMQSLWSNDAGACVLSDTVTVTSPGSQANSIGDTVSVQVNGASTAGYPLTWSAVGLPAGLFIGSTTGLITGTPNTAGVFGVTVTAMDQSGTSRGVSFNWTISQAGGAIKGPNSKCLDDSGAGTGNGNKIDIWTCNHTKAQVWTFNAGALKVLGKCLDDEGGGGAGAKLVLFTCTGFRTQTWSHRSNGEYVLKLNGLCLTDPSSSRTNGTQVQIRSCQNFKDQHWSLP
jgi:serine protease